MTVSANPGEDVKVPAETVMFVVPGATASATPVVGLIVATAVLELVHPVAVCPLESAVVQLRFGSGE